MRVRPSPIQNRLGEITRYFVALLISSVGVLAGLVLDGWWHASGHKPLLTHDLGMPVSLLWFGGLVVILFCGVRMFLSHIRLVSAASLAHQDHRRSVHLANISLFVVLAGTAVVLLTGYSDTFWHHDHRTSLNVLSPFHPYHLGVVAGLAMIVAPGARLFTSSQELSIEEERGAQHSPDARLRIIKGSSASLDVGDGEPAARAVEGLVAGGTSDRLTTGSPLSAREIEVLSLLAGGCSAKEIADELIVSLSTVQRHIANIYAKIGARGRVEAAAYAIERGLVRSRDG